MIARTTLVSLSTVLLVTSCFLGGGAKSPEAQGCPESAEEVGQLEWKLDKEAEAKVKNGLMAARHLEVLSVEAEAELRDPCESIAKEFFASEEMLSSENPEAEVAHMCSLALELRNKLAGLMGGTLSVNAVSSVCLLDMEGANDCFATCDAEALPTVECLGEESGTCEGNCSGSCSIDDESDCHGSCSGTCYGSCDSEFEGVCRGECEGTCDGRGDVAECEGQCLGRCMEGARGFCGGVCNGECESGSCALEAMGECDGVCAGTCDQALKAPRCQGDLALGESPTECQLACRSVFLATAECSVPGVEIEVQGASNEQGAELMDATLSKYGPQILSARAVALQSADLEAAVKDAKAAVSAMEESVDGLELAEEAKSCIAAARKKTDRSALVLGFTSEAATSATELLK